MGRKRQAPAAGKTEQKSYSGVGGNVVASAPAAVPRGIDAAFGYLLLSPALLPLVFIPGFLFPYASPKTIAFRSLGILVLAGLVWLLLARVPLHFGRLKQRITWVPAALLVVACISSLLGVNFQHSFWSTFERGDGLLTLTAEVLFFYAVLLHADTQFLRRFAIASIGVSTVVALYALVQWSNLALQMPIPVIMKSDERIGATFGNAAFMASYLGMCFFLALWIARGCQAWVRVLVYGIAALQLLAILVSQTRGTILALVLAGIVAAGHVAWSGQGRARLLARISLGACVLAFGLFFAFRAQLAQVPIAVVQRIASISPSSGTSAVRLALWKSIGTEALHHPVAGVGAEHVEYTYNRAYSLGLISGQWNDHSHNLYLDYFVQFGLPGLLLFVALVVAAFRAARVLVRTGDTAGAYLFLLFLTYAAQNFFVFDVALTLWMFLTVLACVLAVARSGPQRPLIPPVHGAIRWVLAPAVLLLLVPVTIQPVRANLLAARAVIYGVADVDLERRLFRQALALDTYADLEIGYAAYNNFAFKQEPTLTGSARVTAHQVAQDILAKNLVRYPYDVRTALYLLHVIDRTPPELSQDLALLDKAAAVALRISPRRPGTWYYRANVEIKQGDAAMEPAQKAAHYMNAIGILKQYAELQPQISTPRHAIATLYLQIGDQTQAREWAEAGNAVYRWEPDAARAAAGFYIAAGDWAKAAFYLNEIAGNDMTDYLTVFDLARAKLMSGDRKGARELVDYLRGHSPEMLATDPEFLAQLEAQ